MTVKDLVGPTYDTYKKWINTRFYVSGKIYHVKSYGIYSLDGQFASANITNNHVSYDSVLCKDLDVYKTIVANFER